MKLKLSTNLFGQQLFIHYKQLRYYNSKICHAYLLAGIHIFACRQIHQIQCYILLENIVGFVLYNIFTTYRSTIAKLWWTTISRMQRFLNWTNTVYGTIKIYSWIWNSKRSISKIRSFLRSLIITKLWIKWAYLLQNRKI